MEVTFSWLYGALRPQDCDRCKVAHPFPPYPMGADLVWCLEAERQDADLRTRAMLARNRGWTVLA